MPCSNANSMLGTIAVFCGSHLGRNPRFQSAAQELGRLIASQGRTLLYGGSNCGYMGVVSSAALDAGGRVVGIIPTLFSDEIINSQPRAETVLVSSMQERKVRMIEQSDAFIALPGGIGTIDEVSEVLMSNQLGLADKPMGLLNVEGYYDAFLQQVRLMIEEGFMSPASESLLIVESSPAVLLSRIDSAQPSSNSAFALHRRSSATD